MGPWPTAGGRDGATSCRRGTGLQGTWQRALVPFSVWSQDTGWPSRYLCSWKIDPVAWNGLQGTSMKQRGRRGGSRSARVRGKHQPGLRLWQEVRFWQYSEDRPAAELDPEGPEDGSSCAARATARGVRSGSGNVEVSGRSTRVSGTGSRSKAGAQGRTPGSGPAAHNTVSP